MAASIPLERARSLEPDKSSIREALGRAYFRSARFDKAAEEFAAVVERYPVNDYAHFCLGRSLEKTGRTRRGPPPRRAGGQHAPGPQGLPGAAAATRLPGAPERRQARGPPRARLGHQAEQPVHAALVDGAPPACRRAPRCRASACTPKRTSRVWRFHQSSIQGSRSPGAVQRHRLRAQQPVGDPQAHVERLAVELLAGHGEAPLAVREPPGPKARQPAHVGLDRVHRRHGAAWWQSRLGGLALRMPSGTASTAATSASSGRPRAQQPRPVERDRRARAPRSR